MWWDEYEKIKIEEFYKYIIDIFNLLYGFYFKGVFYEFLKFIGKLEKEMLKNYYD